MANGLTLEQALKRIDQLIEENKRLAEELDSARGQNETLDKGAQQAVSERNAALKDSEANKKELTLALKQLSEFRQANTTFAAQVNVLQKRVDKTPLNPLSVEEASTLFEKVITSFQVHRTLQVKNVSLNLKVATGKIGDTPVLLLPDPKSVDPASLHELKLELGSAPTLEAAATPGRVVVSPPRVVRPQSVRSSKPSKK